MALGLTENQRSQGPNPQPKVQKRLQKPFSLGRGNTEGQRHCVLCVPVTQGPQVAGEFSRLLCAAVGSAQAHHLHQPEAIKGTITNHWAWPHKQSYKRAGRWEDGRVDGWVGRRAGGWAGRRAGRQAGGRAGGRTEAGGQRHLNTRDSGLLSSLLSPSQQHCLWAVGSQSKELHSTHTASQPLTKQANGRVGASTMHIYEKKGPATPSPQGLWREKGYAAPVLGSLEYFGIPFIGQRPPQLPEKRGISTTGVEWATCNLLSLAPRMAGLVNRYSGLAPRALGTITWPLGPSVLPIHNHGQSRSTQTWANFQLLARA